MRLEKKLLQLLQILLLFLAVQFHIRMILQ